MKKILFLILFFVYSFSKDSQSLSELDIDISKFEVASSTNQIILVIPPNYTSTSAMLYFYVKEGDNWVQRTETKAYVGKNGLGKEKEGDKKTPVGVYKFNCYFGILDNPGTNLPYVKVNKSHYWDGDSNSKNYNTLVNDEIYPDFDHNESEHLIEVDPGYEYALNMDYNKEQTPKKGAGLFLHCFTHNKYTAGCVAIDKYDLYFMYKEINKDCRIIIDTKANMTKYYSASNYIKNGLFMFMCFILLL